eukprot:m.86680 g.86680  ORF g.86680 m.86680 type:complete len:371 (-) comp13064_c0_seq4:114-1226(-)
MAFEAAYLAAIIPAVLVLAVCLYPIIKIGTTNRVPKSATRLAPEDEKKLLHFLKGTWTVDLSRFPYVPERYRKRRDEKVFGKIDVGLEHPNRYVLYRLKNQGRKKRPKKNAYAGTLEFRESEDKTILYFDSYGSILESFNSKTGLLTLRPRGKPGRSWKGDWISFEKAQEFKKHQASTLFDPVDGTYVSPNKIEALNIVISEESKKRKPPKRSSVMSSKSNASNATSVNKIFLLQNNLSKELLPDVDDDQNLTDEQLEILKAYPVSSETVAEYQMAVAKNLGDDPDWDLIKSVVTPDVVAKSVGEYRKTHPLRRLSSASGLQPRVVGNNLPTLLRRPSSMSQMISEAEANRFSMELKGYLPPQYLPPPEQ